MSKKNPIIYTEYSFTIGDASFTFIDTPNAYASDDLYIPQIHSHEYYELFFILRGSIKLHTENNTYEFCAGDCVFISAGFTHTSELSKNSQRIAIPFFFKKNSQKTHLKKLFCQYEEIFKNDILIFHDFIGADAFKRLLYYYYSSYPDKEELIQSCFLEIVILLKASAYSFKNTTPMHMLSDNNIYRNYIIDSYISSNFRDGTLMHLSETLHLSCQQTQRLIKKLYGQTFRERILLEKMRYAKDLLLNKDLTVAQIADELGYTYTHSFYTAFKKYYEMTPEQFRRMN